MECVVPSHHAWRLYLTVDRESTAGPRAEPKADVPATSAWTINSIQFLVSALNRHFWCSLISADAFVHHTYSNICARPKVLLSSVAQDAYRKNPVRGHGAKGGGNYIRDGL